MHANITSTQKYIMPVAGMKAEGVSDVDDEEELVGRQKKQKEKK